MTVDLVSAERFPRAFRYSNEWLAANCMGANSICIAEWLSEKMDLRPGMRLLDLGCGRAATSIFFHAEFGVEVWATDLWVGASQNQKRIGDAGYGGSIFPVHADARALPFAGDFFDAITCVDAYSYFGGDPLYLNYLANFVKPGGQIGIAGAGLVKEIEGPLPAHLQPGWSQDLWALHSAKWWRELWERTGIVDIEADGTMPDGWKLWLGWHEALHPENKAEIEMLVADKGQYLGNVLVVGRRRTGVELAPYCWPDNLRELLPPDYQKLPVLRPPAGP